MIALTMLLFAQAQPIPWSKDIEDAKKAAGGTKPIAVFLAQKGCALSGEFLKNLQKDDRLPELAGGLAWLPVQVGTDEYKNWFVKTCGSNAEGTPSLLFLNPKGDNADPAYAGIATVTSTDPDDIVPILRDVLQRSKKEIAERDKARIAEAQAKAKAGATPGEQIAAWKVVIRHGDGWTPAAEGVAEAREQIEKLLQKGCQEMLNVQQGVKQNADALKAYEAIKSRYAGTFIADWANEELVRVRKTAK